MSTPTCSASRCGRSGAAVGRAAGVRVRRVDRTRRAAGRERRAADLALGGLADLRCWTSRSRRSGSGRWRPEHPCLWVDAKVERVRDGARVVHKAVRNRPRVHDSGRREILGIDVGQAETEAFWMEFLGSLHRVPLPRAGEDPPDRGLQSFAGVGADHLHALQAAARHLQRRVQRAGARAAGRGDRPPRGPLPKVARILADAEEDIPAFHAFAPAHRSRLRSTNPPERFNREIGRRTDGVGIFPDDRSLIRLVGMLCLEQNDERSCAAATCRAPRCSRRSRSDRIATPTSTPRSSRNRRRPEQPPSHRPDQCATPTPFRDT
jgi:putative transposase